MIRRTAILTSLFTFTFFCACNKDKDDQAGTLTGFWVGKYGNDGGERDNGYCMLFRDNGTVRVFDGSDSTTAFPAEGTFVRTGEVITTVYQFATTLTFRTSSVLNPSVSHQAGSWGGSPSSTDGGTFYLDKQ